MRGGMTPCSSLIASFTSCDGTSRSWGWLFILGMWYLVYDIGGSIKMLGGSSVRLAIGELLRT